MNEGTTSFFTVTIFSNYPNSCITSPIFAWFSTNFWCFTINTITNEVTTCDISFSITYNHPNSCMTFIVLTWFRCNTWGFTVFTVFTVFAIFTIFSVFDKSTTSFFTIWIMSDYPGTSITFCILTTFSFN